MLVNWIENRTPLKGTLMPASIPLAATNTAGATPAGAIPVAVYGLGTEDKAQIAALTAIATADATDPATTMALANINKAKINQIIAALKA